MVRRAEEQSIDVPGAAAVPWRFGGSVPQPRRAIAVAADAIADFVLEPGGGTTPHLGGDSFNAARTLGRLGLRPVFIGRVSRDRYRRALRGALEQSGVSLDRVVATDDPIEQSGVSLDGVVATDDPTTFARIEIDEYGAASCRFHIDGTSMAGLLPEEARAAMPDRAADGLGRQDLADFDAVLRTAEFAALVAARTCGWAGADPYEERSAAPGGGASGAPRRVDAEWCSA